MSEQNLSNWREGGYRDWCDEQESRDLVRAQSEFAVEIVKATGLKMSDAAAAIAAGNLLSKIQKTKGDTPEDEAMRAFYEARINKLRAGDHNAQAGQREDEKIKLKREDQSLKKRAIILQEDKFKRLLVEKLIDTAKQPEIQKILTSGKPKPVQMELLHEQLFGSKPDEEEAA